MINERQPLISIVIPVYNRENTIISCLNSIVQQTYSNFEIVVVDDCSNDNTAQLVKEYTDNRIRYIRLEQNSGAQASRNRGIKESNSDWIAFQDSDDEWFKYKLEKQVKELQKLDFDKYTLVHCDAIWFDQVNNKDLGWSISSFDGDNMYPKVLSQAGPFFQAMLVSKEALEKIDYLDENVPSYQEWDTAIRLAKYCKFVHIREPLFKYYLNTDYKTISNDKSLHVKGYKYVINKHKDDILGFCGEKAWINHYHTIIIQCLDFEEWKETDFFFDELTVFNRKTLFLKLLRKLNIRYSDIRGSNITKMYKVLLKCFLKINFRKN